MQQPGIYRVFYTDGCARFADSFKIHVSQTLVSIGVDGMILDGMILYTVGGPFATHQWYRNDTLLTGETNDTLIVTQNGRHRVEVTDAYGCSAASEYGVNNMGITISSGNVIRIYSNPVTDILHIQTTGLLTASLKDVTGRELMSLNRSGSFDLSGLASGIYLLELKDRNGKMIGTERIVKQ